MSKGIKKPNKWELINDLKNIREIPERVFEVDIIRSKELLIEIQNLKFGILDTINGLLIANPESDFDYWANRLRQIFTLKELEYLKNLIEKTDVQESNDIFKNKKSGEFFKYCIRYWFNDKQKPYAAISFLFHSMWPKDKTIELDYKLDLITIKDFVEYWNNNLSKFHKHNYKIPVIHDNYKLKTLDEITNHLPYKTILYECIFGFNEKYSIGD